MKTLPLVLGAIALVATQALAGGRHLAHCLPGYGLLALAAVLSWWPARRHPIPRGATACLVTAAVFFSYVAARALFSPEEYLARTDLFMALAAMAMYLIFALNLTSTRLRLVFTAGLVLLGVINCAIGAIQFFKGQNFMIFDFLPRHDYGTRASGFYGYPGHLAAFLAIVVPLGFSITFWSRWPIWAKVIAGYCSFVCLFGLLLTGSRGGYISCAVGLLVFGMASMTLIVRLAAKRATLLFGLTLLVVLAGLGTRYLISENFFLQSRANTTFLVDPSRMQMWQAALKQFRLSPVTGTGSGTYLYYGRQFRDPGMQRNPGHVHNDYLELLAEYGIAGLIAAVLFLEVHLRNGWRAFSSRSPHQRASAISTSNSLALNVGALSASAACLVYPFLDFSLHSSPNMLVAAFLFGVLASPNGTVDRIQQSPEATGLPPFARLTLPAVGLWLAIQALPTWPAEVYYQKARQLLSDPRLELPGTAWELEEFAAKGLAWDPGNPGLHFVRGQAYASLASQAEDETKRRELHSKSLAAYQEAAKLAPGNVGMLIFVGSSLCSMDRGPEAMSWFERAMAIDPNSNMTLSFCASHMHAMGKLVEAEAAYRKAIQLGNPGSEKGLERLLKDRESALRSDPPR